MSLDTPTLPGEGSAAALCDDCPADLANGWQIVGRFLVCPPCAERRRQERIVYLPPVKPRRARASLSAEVQK